MITNQLLSLAQSGLEHLNNQPQAEAELLSSIHNDQQLEAAKYIQDGKNRAIAWKVGGATVAFLGVAATGAFIAYQVNGTARHTIDSLGRFVEGIIPQQSADIQLSNVMSNLELPEYLPLTIASGTATAGIETHDSIFGVDYTGSTTKVKEAVNLELQLPTKYVALKPVQVSVTNASGDTNKEWRLQATVDTSQNKNDKTSQSTSNQLGNSFVYKSAVEKVIEQQTDDGKIRRLGQIIVGSDADKRLLLADNLAQESFAVGCAPIIEGVLPKAVSHAIRQSFTSALAVKGITGMPENIAEAIDQMANNAPIITFLDDAGQTITPTDIRLPRTPIDSKQHISEQLGLNPKHIDITTDPSCAMNDETLKTFAALSAGDK